MAYPTQTMSARTFDFRTPGHLSFDIAAIPPNFQLTGVRGRMGCECVCMRPRVKCGCAPTPPAAAASLRVVGACTHTYCAHAFCVKSWRCPQTYRSHKPHPHPRPRPHTQIPGTPEEKDFPLKTKYGIVCQVANAQLVREALAAYGVCVGDVCLACLTLV